MKTAKINFRLATIAPCAFNGTINCRPEDVDKLLKIFRKIGAEYSPNFRMEIELEVRMDEHYSVYSNENFGTTFIPKNSVKKVTLALHHEIAGSARQLIFSTPAPDFQFGVVKTLEKNYSCANEHEYSENGLTSNTYFVSKNMDGEYVGWTICDKNVAERVFSIQNDGLAFNTYRQTINMITGEAGEIKKVS